MNKDPNNGLTVEVEGRLYPTAEGLQWDRARMASTGRARLMVPGLVEKVGDTYRLTAKGRAQIKKFGGKS